MQIEKSSISIMWQLYELHIAYKVCLLKLKIDYYNKDRLGITISFSQFDPANNKLLQNS